MKHINYNRYYNPDCNLNKFLKKAGGKYFKNYFSFYIQKLTLHLLARNILSENYSKKVYEKIEKKLVRNT